jgi:hypothetical protein
MYTKQCPPRPHLYLSQSLTRLPPAIRGIHTYRSIRLHNMLPMAESQAQNQSRREIQSVLGRVTDVYDMI